MKRFRYILMVVTLLAFMSGCDKGEDVEISRGTDNQILFLYLGMDNNLSEYGAENIASIERGLKNHLIKGSSVVVFDDRSGQDTRLNRYYLGDDNAVKLEELVNYGTDLNSGDEKIFQKAITDLLDQTDATTYILDISSHGQAWVFANDPSVQTKAIVQDGNSWLDMEDIAEAMPSGIFQAVLLDACYMASIEALYPLRYKTQYIMSSVAEVAAEGFPYDAMLGDLFDVNVPIESRLKSCCSYYYNRYKSYGCTISLLKCSEMDQLADEVKSIVSDMESPLWSSDDVSEVQIFNRSLTYEGKYIGDFAYDLGHAIEVRYGVDSDEAKAINAALSRAIIDKQTTDQAFYIHIEHFCGITMYLPTQRSALLNTLYTYTNWYNNIYKNNPLY